MSEKTFLSPGVSTREIDLSQPTKIQPFGVPAGIIGTARRGPAFVPVTVPTFQDFVAKFGNTDGEAFGPLAMHEWMRNAKAGTYVRLLGAGDAKARLDSGRVKNAGFIAGDALPQANGRVGKNVYAHVGNQLGRGYILGCFMSESAGSTVFSEAGLQDVNAKDAAKATAVSAIDTTDVANDTLLQFFVPELSGGETGNSGITEIFLDADKHGSPHDTPAADANRIAIGAHPDSDDATIASLIIKAINGTADDKIVSATGGNGQGTVGVKGITAALTDGETKKITLTVDKLGSSGNSATVTDTGTGAHNIVDVGTFTNGQDEDPKCVPFVRGILMVPSGVVPTIASPQIFGNQSAPTSGIGGSSDSPQAASGLSGGPYGEVKTSNGAQEFVMILNGHKESDSYLNVITASFDPTSPGNFRNVFNTDPTKLEQAGHYLYADWQISPSQASITGSNRTPYVDPDGIKISSAFIVPSSGSRNTGAETTSSKVGHPNLEAFDDRFRTAFSPFVISQKFGGKNENLFRIHALDDGQAGSDTFKITIENIIASTNENRKFGSFDLSVRRFDDSDEFPQVLEKFNKVDLDPSSDRYIARVIGDQHTFYDFDKKAGGQKLVIDGLYPNKSQYIRVETSAKLDEGSVDDSALPVGFRGLHHLVTSGSATSGQSLYGAKPGVLSGSGGTYSLSNPAIGLNNSFFSGSLVHLNQLPVPFRESISKGSGKKKSVNSSLTWGIQFEDKGDDVNQPNKLQKLNTSIRSFVKYFPRHLESHQNVTVGDNEGSQDIGGSILDADRYNNNYFSLERVQVITASNGFPDTSQWAAAKYRRNGKVRASIEDIFGNTSTKTRLLQPAKDFKHLPSRKYLKFTFPLQGGFDGVNIFNEDKAKFTDNAVRREMSDADNQGGAQGPTVAAYRKAIDVMEQKSDVDIKLLATPGIRHESVTDFAIDSVERRFDALYIMDIEEKDTVSAFVTSSADQIINVSNTVTRFTNRNMDSSFAAAYFPDVVITDPSTETNVQCPPSVAVLGALSFNDAVAHPWFAPAGFNRGALSTVVESQVKLNQVNLDELYEADINPLAKFAHNKNVAVFGQKTLLANASALDRVNVRRLLIEIRRQVRSVANTLLFEPNRSDTLTRFSSAVTPILTRIQEQQGLNRFKVQIDTTTTTQADVENNTIRGKIFLQPTRSVEFISLDFVVTNAGAEI